MSKKLFWSIFAGGLILTISFLVYPQLSTDAQSSEKVKEKMDLSDLRNNAAAESFYNYMRAAENDWLFVDSSFSPAPRTVGGSIPATVGMVYRQKDEKVEITVRQHKTEEQAESDFLEINQAAIKDCSGGECGDKGRRIYTIKGKFIALEFRKGLHFVRISTNSEKSAEKFALNFIQSLGG